MGSYRYTVQYIQSMSSLQDVWRTYVVSNNSYNFQYQIQIVNDIGWGGGKYAMQIFIFHHKVEISSANHMYTSCLGLIQRSMHGPDIVIIFQRLMS